MYIYIYVKNEMIVIVNEYNVCICLYMFVYSVPIFRIHKTLIWIIYVVVLPITNTKQTTSWSSLSTRVHYRSISIRNIEWPCFLTSTYKYFFMGCHPIQVDSTTAIRAQLSIGPAENCSHCLSDRSQMSQRHFHTDWYHVQIGGTIVTRPGND